MYGQHILVPLKFHTKYLAHTLKDMIFCHYSDVIIGAIKSQLTSLTIVYLTVFSDTDQRKHQSFTSLAVNSLHKWPVTRKMFPFDDVIICSVDNLGARMRFWNAPPPPPPPPPHTHTHTHTRTSITSTLALVPLFQQVGFMSLKTHCLNLNQHYIINIHLLSISNTWLLHQYQSM